MDAYTAGYAAAMTVARADLDALTASFERNYAALMAELEKLQREVAELRTLAGQRDPSQPLQ